MCVTCVLRELVGVVTKNNSAFKTAKGAVLVVVCSFTYGSDSEMQCRAFEGLSDAKTLRQDFTTLAVVVFIFHCNIHEVNGRSTALTLQSNLSIICALAYI